MKVLSSFVIFIVMLSLAACSTETKIVAADALVAVAVPAFEIVGSCTETTLIKADVQAKVYEWFKINNPQQTGLLKDLCKTAIAEIAPKLIGTGFKAEWKCSLTNIDNAATLIADMACANIKE
jgi:hypothetical protein